MRKRRLVALMFCDLVDYGTVTTENEALALDLLEEHRAIVRRLIPLYAGRENKTIGDAFFIEFGSAIEAVLCAMEIQTCLYERNLGVPRDRRILARIGVHLGDVVLAEGDSFGQGVNVAARLEAFAEPGGICVSRSVAEQLLPHTRIRLKKLGRRRLKHVAARPVLYKVLLPWDDRPRLLRWPLSRPAALRPAPDAPTRAESRSRRVAETLAVCLVALFAFLSVRTVEGFKAHYRNADVRQLAGTATPRVSLVDGWQYTLAPFDDSTSTADEREWRDFVRPYWRHADELVVPYWMRLEFRATDALRHPAIVLGPISGAHHAYLNGRFIGGSRLTLTLAHYAVDPGLLDAKRPNTLLVKVSPKPSITPGIVNLPQVPSFLGEFEDVYAVVTKNELYYHVAQNLYLMLALLCFLGCALFYASNRGEKAYLYFALYLLLGAMSLLHSNGFVSAFLDFRLQRAFRLFGLSVSSILLFSMYLHVNKRRGWEIRNNAAAIIWAVALFVTLAVSGTSAERYLWWWNAVLGGTVLYTSLWVVPFSSYRLVHLLRDRNGRRVQWRKVRYEGVVFAFGALTAMLALSSMKMPLVKLLPEGMLRLFFTLGTTYPFWFAGCVLALGLFDYLEKDRSVRRHRREEDLLLFVADTLKNFSGSGRAARKILGKVSEFVGAQRSTVYLVEGRKGDEQLRAHAIVGPQDAKTLVRTVTPASHGVLGYVCENRTPLLIRDILSDARFNEHVLQRRSDEAHAYRTNSCMLFPLVIANRLLGVLTIADKDTSVAFSERDFTTLTLIAKDLATVIHWESLRATPSRTAS